MDAQEKSQFLMTKATLQNLKRNSKEYWEQRCIQLEIYKTLVNK